MFAAHFAMWLGIALAYVAISALLNKLGYLGSAAEWLLTPVFLGGIMLGFDAVRRGEPLRFSHLFDGFRRQHFVPLLLVGVFNLVLTFIALVVGVAAVASGIDLSASSDLFSIASDPLQVLRAYGLTVFLLIVLALIVATVIAMANWFAPALIVLHEAQPAQAMLASFGALMRNWAAFLVYGAIGIGISVAASIGFVVISALIGFGTIIAIVDGTAGWESIGGGLAALGAAFFTFLIVIAMVTFGSTYSGYRDTLAADASPPDKPV